MFQFQPLSSRRLIGSTCGLDRVNMHCPTWVGDAQGDDRGAHHGGGGDSGRVSHRQDVGPSKGSTRTP